jgi:hypothetical protein
MVLHYKANNSCSESNFNFNCTHEPLVRKKDMYESKAKGFGLVITVTFGNISNRQFCGGDCCNSVS